MKGSLYKDSVQFWKTSQGWRVLLVPSLAVEICLLAIQLEVLEHYKPLVLSVALHTLSQLILEHWIGSAIPRHCREHQQLQEHLTAVTCAITYCILWNRTTPENETLTSLTSLVVLPTVLACLLEGFGLASQLALLLHFLLTCLLPWGGLEFGGRAWCQRAGSLLVYELLLFKVGKDRASAQSSAELTNSIFSTLTVMFNIMSDAFLVLDTNERVVGANEGIDVCLGSLSGSELHGKALSEILPGSRPPSGLDSTWYTRSDGKRIKLEVFMVPCDLPPGGLAKLLKRSPSQELEMGPPRSCRVCALRILEEAKENSQPLRPPPAAQDWAPFLSSAGFLQTGAKSLAPLFFKSPWRFESIGRAAESSFRKVGVPDDEGKRGEWTCAEGKDGKQVAIKEISLAGMSSQRDFTLHLTAISREAEALKRISWASPVVIRLCDCWLQNDFSKACLVTEWLPQTLEGVLSEFRQQGMVSVCKLDARKWFTHMVSGVAAIHAAGFLHRDIQPSNVWLTADRGRCKIAGLGISRPLQRRSACSKTVREQNNYSDWDDSESGVGSTLSEDNFSQVSGISGISGLTAFLGPCTNAYSSPELVREHRCTARADVFSLGCILLEMLTLAPLAELGIGSSEESPDEVSWSLVADARVRCFEVADPQSLSVNSSDLPGLVSNLLNEDPSLRPQASDIIARSVRLQSYLPELCEESSKLRGVLLRSQRRVHFNAFARSGDEDATSDCSSSALDPAVA